MPIGSAKSFSSVSQGSASGQPPGSGSGSASGSGSGDITCPECDGPVPATITVEISGVTNAGSCTDCAAVYNGTHVLEFIADCDVVGGYTGASKTCSWYKIGDHPCTSSTTPGTTKYLMYVWFGGSSAPGGWAPNEIDFELFVDSDETAPCAAWNEGQNAVHFRGETDGTCKPGTIVLTPYSATPNKWGCNFNSATITVTAA